MSFSTTILSWYRQNKRDLPWRNTRDPYKIWLSEILLQQTRVEQGLPYYYKFTEAFPYVSALAQAKEEKVLRLWQGLGYYSRARNLHAAANDIMTRFAGKFPDTYDNVRSLKGVGDYTAAAICSFAYNQNYPVVDGNVFRILSRYFGIEDPIDKNQTKKAITTLAAELLKGFRPDEFNQAIMEFGAVQCKPASPDCGECPLSQGCYALKNNKVGVLPFKEKKTKIRARYFHYIVIENTSHFYIQKRNLKDIWQGLHDFPLIETKKVLTPDKLKKEGHWKNFGEPMRVSEPYKHVLSHQHIHARFYHVNEKDISNKSILKGLIRVNKKTIQKYALPKLIETYTSTMRNSV
jgi:A/G-specific adenine glycosylase